MTIPYYDQNGQAFFDRTVNINLHTLYETYARYLPANAHILDAGCGSGRDSKAFLKRGYAVSAFDASKTMVQLAREYTGLPVKQHTFAEMTYRSQFDGVWANASLLHLPYKRLPATFDKIAQAIKHHGMVFMSFKVGQGEHKAPDGRHFTHFDEAHLRDLIAQFPEFLIESILQTTDDRGEDYPDWLNVFVRYLGR
ncbi:MAG: class I SAM-dependent methyltransferase [Anaerolineae bacterium]